MTTPTLTDDIVTLDAHTLGDVSAHLAGEDEEQARRFGWYPARSTEEGVRAAIERWQEQWRSQGDTRAFALRECSSGELAGGCEIRLRESGRAEMSYWVFPPFRARGFARRGVQLLCEWAFAVLGVARIELYIEPDNEGSLRVARHVGFVEEGILRSHEATSEGRRDMTIYSLLPSDLA